MVDNIVRQAVAQAKAGNKTEARKLATQAVRADPNNVGAWVVMAQVVTDRKQAIDCLEKVLKLEPGHPWATLHLNRLKSGGASQAPTAVNPAASREAAPKSEPEEDDLMADLRRRSSSTADLELSDLDDFMQLSAPPSANAGPELDPLAGTQAWQRPLSEGGEFRYDQVADELDALKPAPAKRRGIPCLLFIVVFLVALVLAFLVGAYMMGLLPFQ